MADSSTKPGTITLEEQDGCSVVRLDGEHDLTTAREIRAALLRQAEQRDVIVDLSATTFLDSAALQALFLGRRRTVEEHGHHFVLQLGDALAVQQVLEITGFLQLFDHARTRDEALAKVLTGESQDG